MISLAVKSHWKLAYRTFKKAIKVTLQDIKQIFNAHNYNYKISDDIDKQRYFYKIYEELEHASSDKNI
ncbi:MAG: hypothetical protein WHS65_10120 [Melioribacteraceae bacterium]